VAVTGVVDVRRIDAAGLEREFEALSDILHACVHGGAAVSFVLPFSMDEARAFWRAKVAPGVAAGTRVLLGAFIDGAAVGSVQLDLDTPPNQPHRGEVAKLIVHPRVRRRGVARALMAEIEKEARRAGRTLVTLDTRTGDAAEPLYVSMGYEIAGRIPGYARNATEPGFHATTIFYKTIGA
jgi:ribosomal protein S18 acetylase RimI-like enzyme